jgi:glycosyltransferase involved in cell wall biosynthesis
VVGLLQGYAKFLELYPDSDINLVIAGPENNLYQEIPETIEKLHLSSRVHFLGILSEEELNFLIVGACAYVYPSFYEGFGIPPLEAMMCHVPVACSCTSSVPEVCGDAPVYFSPHDTESIAEALYQVAYDEKIREQCIARGKEQIQKYSWEKMGQEMLARYEQLMAEK